jgi:hypothetical protein
VAEVHDMRRAFGEGRYGAGHEIVPATLYTKQQAELVFDAPAAVLHRATERQRLVLAVAAVRQQIERRIATGQPYTQNTVQYPGSPSAWD